MEWDENKNISNLKKHGLTFEDASTIFDDPNILEYYDKNHSTKTEDRYICYGDIGNCLIAVVVYTDKQGTIRIISARKANSEERRVYYANISPAS